jgi:hypothetical protein
MRLVSEGLDRNQGVDRFEPRLSQNKIGSAKANAGE